MQGRLTEFCILFLCPLDGEQFKVSQSGGILADPLIWRYNIGVMW